MADNEEKRREAINEFTAKVKNEKDSFIQDEIKEFDKENEIYEGALRLLISAFPGNITLSEVLVKVTCLNDYYSTNLNAWKSAATNKTGKTIAVDVGTMASHIAENHELAALLANGDLEAVEYIRTVKDENGDQYSDAYSFATKYCNWHQPDAFPIVDRYSKGMIYYCYRYQNQEICVCDDRRLTQSMLNDYAIFRECYGKVKSWVERCCGKPYTMKEIDKVLWQYACKDSVDAKIAV